MKEDGSERSKRASFGIRGHSFHSRNSRWILVLEREWGEWSEIGEWKRTELGGASGRRAGFAAIRFIRFIRVGPSL